MLLNHLVSLAQATARIQDGQTIAFGGLTLYRRPVAFALALLRRTPPPRDLTLLCFTAGIESDILVGAGCVRAVRSCYFGLEAFGFAPMFTQAAQRGEIQVIEETEASLALGVRAAISGVGFLPSRAWLGTDLPRLRPDVQSIQDPYSDDTLLAFPAIHCDVAVIHALAADAQGNVLINNNLGIDLELVYLAKTVIVTTETLVDALQPIASGVILPHPAADVIVHTPRGAWPTSCHPHYPVDGTALMAYVDACNAGTFTAHMAAWPDSAL